MGKDFLESMSFPHATASKRSLQINELVSSIKILGNKTKYVHVLCFYRSSISAYGRIGKLNNDVISYFF